MRKHQANRTIEDLSEDECHIRSYYLLLKLLIIPSQEGLGEPQRELCRLWHVDTPTVGRSLNRYSPCYPLPAIKYWGCQWDNSATVDILSRFSSIWLHLNFFFYHKTRSNSYEALWSVWSSPLQDAVYPRRPGKTVPSIAYVRLITTWRHSTVTSLLTFTNLRNLARYSNHEIKSIIKTFEAQMLQGLIVVYR